jgi:hypothetical protein
MSEDSPGLGVAVVLWRRRWWGGVAVALILMLGVPWAMSASGRLEATVRVPTVGSSVVASPDSIRGEVAQVIGPAVVGDSFRPEMLGISNSAGFVILSIPEGPPLDLSTDPSIENIMPRNELLMGVARGLERWFAEILQQRVDLLGSRIDSATAALEAMRSRSGGLIESGEVALGIAELEAQRDSALPGGLVGDLRTRGPGSAASSRLVAVAVLAAVLGFLAACAVEVIVQAIRADRQV